MTTEPLAPLAGIRVVEVANFVAVPSAGTLLADLGADVIKVELPPRGELYRRSRPKYAGYDTEFPENPAFHMDNRGKRSIALDLTNEQARDALHRLIDKADVFLTNLLPQRRTKYGLDHETLLARNARLVVGAINGYGNGGDEADRPAFDYAAYWARTGLMDAMRDDGLPPSLQRPGVGDHAAASNLIVAVLSALRLRDQTGEGRYVETSLLQTGLYVMGNDVALSLVTGEQTRRHDRNRTQNPLWNSYPVAGDRWILLVMIEADRYWAPLCKAIDRADLVDDERYADGFKRAEHAESLIQELEQTFAKRTLEEWRKRLDGAGLIWSPVGQLDEIIHDPQVHAMGYLCELDHPEAGSFTSVAPPFTIEGAAVGSRRTISPVHADAEEVLREAGLSDAEIEGLL